jgi:hypothetical protein
MNKFIALTLSLLSLVFATVAQAGAYRIPPNEVTAEQLQLPPTMRRALNVCPDGSLDVDRCKSTLIDITSLSPDKFDTNEKRASCGDEPTACQAMPTTTARVPEAQNVIPASAPDKVHSVTLISILSENGLTQIVATGNELTSHIFLMQPPEGSKEGVELLDILTCIKRINPFDTGSNQGLFLKNRNGLWHYVQLSIANVNLESTPFIKHRCD